MNSGFYNDWMLEMKDILFVCTGNTCRSPMAEGIAKALDKNGRRIWSRGVNVAYESGANEKAIKAMASKDIDISAHKSKQFDPAEVTKNTIILTMTAGHKAYLTALYPQVSSQVFTLLEYVGETGDIDDPYGQSDQVYMACASQLESVIKEVIKIGGQK